MARPSLADSLKASLSKGVHVDTAERIKQGLPNVDDSPTPLPVINSDIKTRTTYDVPYNETHDEIALAATDDTYDQTLHETHHTPSHDTPDGSFDITSATTSHDTSNASSHVPSAVSSHITSNVPPTTQHRYTERDTDRNTNTTEIRSTLRSSSSISTCSTDQHTLRDTERIIARHTDRITNYHDPVMTLTIRQGMCLYYLLQRPDYIAQRQTMGETLNLPLPTIRDCITVLVRERFISKPHKIVIRSFQGFTYRLADEDQCARFMSLRGEEFAAVIDRNMARYTPRMSDRMTSRHRMMANDDTYDGPSNVSPLFSSSRIELKPTTTESQTTDDLLKDPELGYWRERGVNNRQVNSWSEEFQMPVEQVLQSLKYCRYDMVVLNQEEEKQISNPMNWFYKVMQRSGLYPKPNGYKSLAEIRAEQMEQAAKEAAEIRERATVAQREMTFQRIMSTPDSEEYISLLANVSDFSKEIGGKALEVALREAFDGITNQPKGE